MQYFLVHDQLRQIHIATDKRDFDRNNPSLVIFVSPEWLRKTDNMDKVKSLYEQKRLGLIAIDEAHLI